MAIPSASDTVLSNLNVIISACLAERDRLNILFKASLPGNLTIWNSVSAQVRASVITDCSDKLTVASNTLTDVIESVGAL